MDRVRGFFKRTGGSPPEASQAEGSNESPSSKKPLSDAEMVQRARDEHRGINFNTLAAGPNAGGPWKRVEALDHFVLFRQDMTSPAASAIESSHGPEVLCAGRLDACIEEILAVVRPRGEAQHNAIMTALYAKRFLCGSVERSVSCTDVKPDEKGEELVLKTSTFARSGLFSINEQWCYTDFFQRKEDRDGFTISQRSLPPHEFIPGRMAEARVNQVHDLITALLVDLDPGSKGLRVVYNAMYGASSHVDKTQTRRLVALASGVMKIPRLIRSRRFGFQLPADLDAIDVVNPLCPCCTRSLSPVKMSLSAAASALSCLSLSALKMDNRRCYLCGYLVCIDCWSAETMETKSGSFTAIIICRRCQNCVNACDYTDIAVDPGYGPARVVQDPPDSSTAALLVDFLAESLTTSPINSPERANVLAVVQMLLQHEKASSDDENDSDQQDNQEQYDADAIAKVDEFLRDERNLPLLENCTLGNAERRSYTLELPEEPETSVPQGPIPSNEDVRLSAAKAAGLLLLAHTLAPDSPETQIPHQVDVRDLELVCRLAMKTIGCGNAMISIMGPTHEHVLASTDPNFAGAAVPRDYTMCQHQLMSQDPLVLIHPEADVRLQAIQTVKLMSLRSYIGFPVTAPALDSVISEELAVGTLCCLDTTPHYELTRSQYATMQNLARTASKLVQQKARQLEQKTES